MRVLMLSYGHLRPTSGASQIGGAARQCLKLSKALISQNVDVTILTNRLSWSHPAHGTVEGVPVVFLNTWRPLFDRRGLTRVGTYVYMLCTLLYLFRHRNEYDIIHAHSALVSGFVGVLAGRWLKRTSIIKVMNSGFRNDIVRFRQDRTTPGARWMADYLIHCDRVITLNTMAYDQLISLGFRPTQIELIPNGVEVAEIEAKKSYDGADVMRVIFVGRLDEAKGLDVLLDAFKILITRQAARACQLTIVGKGPLECQLHERARALGIAEWVRFAGEVMDVPAYLSGCDIFVLPSRAEGVSNALLEAMASGLACIATDIPGNDVLIQHERNGLLVEEDAEVALAGAIHRLASDADLRERLGRAARQTVEHQFDIADIAREYASLYKRLLETSKCVGIVLHPKSSQ